MVELAWALVGCLTVVCAVLVVLLMRERDARSPALAPPPALAQPPAAAESPSSQSIPSGFHKLNKDLQTRGRATTFTSAGSREKRPGGVVRIALTGGPCAGKSSALPFILDAAKKEGFDCYVGPETATVMANCGCQFPSTIEGLETFQKQIFRMQLQMESALTNVAEETKRPSIIIFDRGIFDGKGYCPSDQFWENVIREYSSGSSKVEIEEMLMLRYEAVVHMVTAADGAEHYYKFGNTVDNTGKPVVRHESPEQAVALDHKMWQVWDAHDNHIKVGNSSKGFEDKLREVGQRIVNVAKSVIDDISALGSEKMEIRRSIEAKVGDLITKQLSAVPGPTVGNMASRLSMQARSSQRLSGLEAPSASGEATPSREPLLHLPL